VRGDARSLDVALCRQIEQTHERLGVSYGDLAVLVHRRDQVERVARLLRRASLPCIGLEDYDGVTRDRVKVGTFKRAKGLEFKYVLLPGLGAGPVARWDGECGESYRERAERLRRELYVGMTRARDGLWLGYVTD
jgi:superfamily I DNA/RNA helicase